MCLLWRGLGSYSLSLDLRSRQKPTGSGFAATHVKGRVFVYVVLLIRFKPLLGLLTVFTFQFLLGVCGRAVTAVTLPPVPPVSGPGYRVHPDRNEGH